MKKENYKPEGVLLGPNGEKVEIILVTPELAEEYLSRNDRNRRKKERSIDRYARDMESGAWKFNGAPIILSEEGELLDGQNRLTAIIKSGISVYMIKITITKDDRGVMETIDQGNSRSNSDNLQIMGIKNATLMSRTTKKILAEDMGLTTKGVAVSVSEQIEELDREDRAGFYSKASEFANRIYKQYRMFSTTVLSSAYVRLNILGCPEETINDFFDQLADLKPACGTVRNLRAKIRPDGGRKLSAEDKEHYLIIAFNAFCRGALEFNVKPLHRFPNTPMPKFKVDE